MRCAKEELPPPDPELHKTGSDGHIGTRGRDELHLLEHFGMQPTSDILDIGCGIGRLAYECADYLDDDATYTGLDIAPVAIDWLNANYAPRLPGFRFDLLDVYSERYRPDGEQDAEGVLLPYDDGQFDVVCAFEVFMHVTLEGIGNYLTEIARVLRPGGLAVVTLVAMYPGEPLPDHGDRRPYVELSPGRYTRYPRRRAVSMAYDVGLIRSLVSVAGLEETGHIKGRVHIPLEDRPGVKFAREQRRRQTLERLIAEAALEGRDLLAQKPKLLEPKHHEELVHDPLSHPCDVFASRKR
jgi:SAM-dependent methyltransferase